MISPFPKEADEELVRIIRNVVVPRNDWEQWAKDTYAAIYIHLTQLDEIQRLGT